MRRPLGGVVAVRVKHPALLCVIAADQQPLGLSHREPQRQLDQRKQPPLQPRADRRLQLRRLDQDVAALLQVVHHRHGALAVVAHHPGQRAAVRLVQGDQRLAQVRLEDPGRDQHRRVQGHARVAGRRGQGGDLREEPRRLIDRRRGQHSQRRIQQQPVRRWAETFGDGPAVVDPAQAAQILQALAHRRVAEHHEGAELNVIEPRLMLGQRPERRRPVPRVQRQEQHQHIAPRGAVEHELAVRGRRRGEPGDRLADGE